MQRGTIGFECVFGRRGVETMLVRVGLSRGDDGRRSLGGVGLDSPTHYRVSIRGTGFTRFSLERQGSSLDLTPHIQIRPSHHTLR
jgi:hypothetical protein